MLILRVLLRSGSLHGFEIANQIQSLSLEVLQVEEGSLYPALQRMLMKGWLQGTWGKTGENRRARYYTLTRTGHQQLEAELSRYQQVSTAIARVLKPA